MNCSIVYYLSHKTGYIQKVLDKKFRINGNIKLVSSLAAVSVEDICGKFAQALEQSDLILVIGGMSAAAERNIITVLSDYFSNTAMSVEFNKKIINPDGGKDGNLIKSGEKYIAILPDEPNHIENMVGSELMKNIKINTDKIEQYQENDIKHKIVFASVPDDTYNVLKGRKKSNILLKICIAVGIATVVAAAVWISAQFAL